MTLDSLESLKACIYTGTYSTNMSIPRGHWNKQQEGTFADYLSMKAGDNIYFFIQRKIYGIGLIININNDCKYLNYVGADNPRGYTEEEKLKLEPLLPHGSANNRCFCTFIPSPYFFEDGIDMDDALSSNPSSFRMLRAMWKVSFIKVDDEENKALIDIILKRNEEKIFNGMRTFLYDDSLHTEINKKDTTLYRLNSYRILASCENGNVLKHEMALEAALCEILVKDNNTPFGKWEYISHQVIASPFKAIDYMDKMDVFGYKYIPGYKTISKYLIIELKKDAAGVGVIEQIMKYVDWIQSEYAYGDYSMIQAFIVASDFSDEVIARRDSECIRNFTKGYRPTVSCKWDAVKLVKYEYDNGELLFTEI